ncbi:hypothetical protein ABEB36_007861 [Hypothenemus hampei]|uniref:THAP-type domain-containing protein n=1 Tax=Hypothenemus hampei TaxID=57062 RepID=A0ABD1E6L8_HYPHA
MGFKCCVSGCTSTSAKVSMHSFPIKDAELCRLWLKRINNHSLPDDIQQLKSYRVCTIHFDSSCKRDSKTHPLIWNSIPSLNLPDFNESTSENCFLIYSQRRVQYGILNTEDGKPFKF